MFTIKYNELIKEIYGRLKVFPKYASPIMNLANRFARATWPNVVGQMSELINECPKKDPDGWAEWYKKKHPQAIPEAKGKIRAMLVRFRDSIDQLLENDEIIEMWVEDLVIDKTYIGLKNQKVIIKKLAQKMGVDYRFSTPKEESKGIDGYVGKNPVQIKPDTYEAMSMLSEQIKCDIIYYKKTKEGIVVNDDAFMTKNLNSF